MSRPYKRLRTDLDTANEEPLCDSILASVLSRLPCRHVVGHARFVCRRWHRIIGDRALMRRPFCLRSVDDAARALTPPSHRHARCVVDFETGEYETTCLIQAAQHGDLVRVKSARATLITRRTHAAPNVAYRPTVHGTSVCDAAAGHGHLQVLQYLARKGYAYGATTFATAARGADYDVIDWLYMKKCPWDERACAGAARAGDLDSLAYLHRRGCPWDESACIGAAEADSVECLRYLRDRRCPWTARTCIAAARACRLDALAFIYDNECSWWTPDAEELDGWSEVEIALDDIEI